MDNSVFVKAMFDVNCDWEGLAPVYRIYVNDELFAERTWTWNQHFLTEMLQITAEPGDYAVRFEPVGPQLANFTLNNYRIEHGPAEWTKKNTHVRINHASQ